MNRRRLVALLLPVALAVTVLGSRAAPAQTITPPIAYPHVATIGQTGQPYRRSDANLNQPVGLGADRDGVWIANGAGRNLLRFGLAGVESLGRAGALDALYGRPLRFLADVAVVNLWGGRPSPTATPRTGGGRVEPPTRTVWFVDQGGHVAVGLPPRDERFPAPPIVVGETDMPGDDDGHLRDPTGIAADSVGNVFVSDTGNHRVQIFAPDGKHLATIGQTGRAGAGPGQLDHPQRLTVSSAGRLYVADTGNHRVVAYEVSDPRAPRELQMYG
ncbi:MAG TPA: NHL repeat-containing protein, partial [Anaerolineae bacterium]|nr:NHL repeat-containing protein [Anaerolineae bacterium]